MNWFPVELHCHTVHSDGVFTPSELVEQAGRFGLAGIALTDHNTVSGWRETCACAARRGLCVLPGAEWTTYYGHMVVLGDGDCGGWMDLLPDGLDAAAAAVKARGGTAGVAHPFRIGNPVGTGCHWDFRVRHWENIGYYEVLSGADPTRQCTNRKALETWTELLDRGCRLTPASGIDWHRPLRRDLPYASTYVGVPDGRLTAAAMQAAVAEGRTSLTLGPLLTVSVENGGREYGIGSTCPKGSSVFVFSVDRNSRLPHWSHLRIVPRELRVVAGGGSVLLRIPLLRDVRRVSRGIEMREPWCRAELWGDVLGSESLIALTAPLYFEEHG